MGHMVGMAMYAANIVSPHYFHKSCKALGPNLAYIYVNVVTIYCSHVQDY